MTISVVLLLFTLLACGLSWRGWRGGEPGPDRWLAAAVPLAALVCSGLVVERMLASVSETWSSQRLLWSAALLAGEQLYGGDRLGLMYPPGGALAYLPAALLPRPDLALAAGTLMAIAWFFGPAWLLLCSRSDGEPGTSRCRLALAGTLLAMLVVRGQPGLSSCAYFLHVDAPALSLCLLACWALTGTHAPSGRRGLALAALFAVGAVWTKQVFVTALVALPLATWRVDRARARDLVVALLGVGVVVSGAFALAFDPAAMAEDFMARPGRHVWTDAPSVALPRSVGELIRSALPFAALPALAALGALGASSRSPAPPEEPRRLEAWRVLGWLALLSAPVAALSRCKTGAGLNVLAPPAIFAGLAALLLLLERARSEQGRAARWTLAVLLAGATLAEAPRLLEVPRLAQAAPRNPHALIHALAQRRPGEVFAPTFPLATLMAEGRADHTFDGLEQAFGQEQRPLDAAALRAGLPPSMRFVVVVPGAQGFLRRLYPELGAPQQDPSLPGLVVLEVGAQ
jgi:hypothetical protein